MKTRIVSLIVLLTVAAVSLAEENNETVLPKTIDPNVIEAKLSDRSATEAAESVVVAIDDFKITEKTLDDKLKPALEKMASQIPPQYLEQYKTQLRKNMLEQLVIEHLMMAEAKQNKIEVSTKEVEDEIKKQLAGQNMSIEDFKELLKAYGTSYEEQEEQVKDRLFFTKLIDQKIAGETKVVTVDEARKFYDENTEQFETPAQTRTSHILISTESDDPNSDPNQVKAAALAKTEDLLKQIKGGSDFAELAKENSICPSGKSGGDLGLQPKGALVPEYENAAAALELGQVSDVVETQFGYHIIKLTGQQDANTVSFDEARDDILLRLTDMQKGQLVQAYIAELLSNAKITYTNPEDAIQIPLPPAPQANAFETKEAEKVAEAAPEAKLEEKNTEKNNYGNLEQFNFSCSFYAYCGFGWRHQNYSQYFNITAYSFLPALFS